MTNLYVGAPRGLAPPPMKNPVSALRSMSIVTELRVHFLFLIRDQFILLSENIDSYLLIELPCIYGWLKF